MIKLKIEVDNNGVISWEERFLEDEHDFREEYDCKVVRDLLDGVIN